MRLRSLTVLLILLFLGCRQREVTSEGSIEAFFSAQEGIEWVIEREIEAAERSVDAAVYTFTSRPLAQALVDAAKRGVKVRVILDPASAGGEYSKAEYLVKNNIDVRVEKGAGIMHHKFVLIDDSVTITGSFNWTASAETQNDENILLIKGFDKIYRSYASEFGRLWRASRIWSPLPEKEALLSADDIRRLRRHIGENVIISGLVVRVGYSERSNTYFLDFSEKRDDFTVVIFSSVADKFERAGINIFDYEGKAVEVSGELIDHPEYGLEIILEDASSIEVKGN
ncbi:DUF1669 domain-containing protein [candidate division WOR-3 bacterium]|uniref:phospholipase D n=1 Tax=candidate division WOR-3 bacterium TaxID=2052148 RepID=A0A9D5KBZ2_UNCW3|nr:DUF1669 domain-containing protein [candidate division WOR-3 bacterium]MBD3365260.1 DUF1669 domain-containing protein [candidate division WOR-3 bacterium]